jgi:hypothetical protein
MTSQETVSGADSVQVRSNDVHTSLTSKTVGQVTALPTTRLITADQFAEIAKTYAHACLEDGIAYLRTCKKCSCNAPKDVKPESSETPFIRGDAGFLSHMTQAHQGKMITMENLYDYCDRDEVDHDDAVLMSKGEAPKKPVMLINARRKIPWEDFRNGGTY